MNINMKKKLTILVSILVFGTLAFFSCDVTLGTKLNLDPPTVTITTPDYMHNITEPFLTIAGTAKDLEEIVFVYITIEKTKDEEWKYEYIGERGAWRSSHNNDPWINIDGAWNGKNNIEWSIEVPMDITTEQGEFLITVNAKNNVLTEGPAVQRRVIIDNTPPIVTILFPVLQFEDTEDNTYDFLTDVKPAFDDYDLRDLAVLDLLLNRSIKIQYEIEDISIASLTFQLADHTGDIIYYNKDVPPHWSGQVIIDADEIRKDGVPLGRTGEPTYMQLISIAEDIAGNSTMIDGKKQSHGWLVWWPEADDPWSEGIETDGSLPDTQLTQVFPGSTVRGQANDNQGVKSVQYEIFRWGGSSFTATGIAETLINTPKQEGADPSRFFPWSFTAPDVPSRYRANVITTDIYNNTSVDLFYFYVYPNQGGPLLVSFSGSSNPGTYGLGTTIEIHLNLREPVNVTGSPRLRLNVAKTPTATAYAIFDNSSNGHNTLRFNYPVAAGDSVDLLRVMQIDLNGSVWRSLNTNENLIDVSVSEFDPEEDRGLEFYTAIRIITDNPVFNTASFTGSSLTLNFSKEIYKGAGNITLTQAQTTYRAPAVLSVRDYNTFVSRDPTNTISAYYQRGTNGAHNTGIWEADTTEKYILRYDIEPANTTLVNALVAADANKVIIPVVSGAVTIGGTGNRSLIIDLSETWGYEMRVKGVSYSITFPEGFVVDSQDNKVQALQGTGVNISNPGVNAPFIRVQKNKETLSGNPVAATQPNNTSVRIDCQTPGAITRYTYNTITTTQFTGNYNGTSHRPNAVTMPATSTTQASTFTLGDNTMNGLLYGIRAEAEATNNGTTHRVQANEIAARSVIQFTFVNNDMGNWNRLAALFPARQLQVWIRGGDQTSGDNNTAGFPLTWDDNDYSGVRLMTTNGNVRHWITWEVNVPAYFHFLAGTTDNQLADIQANGPINWCWGKNRWAFQYLQFPLYPGSSLTFTRTTITETNATENFEFFPQFSGNRR